MSRWQAFRSALVGPDRGRADPYAANDEHEVRFEALLAEARATRPTVDLYDESFADFLGRLLRPDAAGELAPAEASGDVIDVLASRNIADLLLVSAFERGAPEAVAAIEEILQSVIGRVHATISTGMTQDELVQELRVHLLVPRADAPARIRDYAGKSALGRWIHVAATRHALNLTRTKKREIPFEEALFVAQPDLKTPEARLLYARVGQPIRDAVGRALTTLDERDRSLLWMALVDGVPAERIAKVYDVHRTTVARWIAAAADALRKSLEQELRADPGLRASELSSLVRSVLSQFSAES